MRIIVWEKEICVDEEADGEIILYSLASSHSIRIDTILYMGTRKTYVKLEGSALRHLYPQKRSLEGFVKKIICGGRKAPGVARVSSIQVRNIRAAIVPGSTNTPLYTALSVLGNTCSGNILVTNNDSLAPHDAPRIMISPSYAPYFITASHYIIDQAIGAAIRRKGRIEHREQRRP